MKSSPQYIQLMDEITPVAVTSSTDASPSVVTATAHGLVTGNLVAIYGHTTNIAINGINEVIKTGDNTFTLKNPYTKVAIDTSGAGAGSGGVLTANPIIARGDNFSDFIIEMVTSGSATMSVQFATSEGMSYDDSDNGGILPNIGGTISPQNPWNFVDYIQRDGGGAIVPAATSLDWAGTDLVKSVELNIGAAKYIAVIVTAFTQGALSARLGLYQQ